MPGFVATAPGVQTDAVPEQMHMNGHKCPGPDGLDQEAAARDADAVHADDGSTAATGQTKEKTNRNINTGEQTKGKSHARACSRQSRIDTDRTPKDAHFEDNAKPINAKAGVPCADDDSDQRTDRSTRSLRGSRRADNKGETPETTPAGSDGPAGSPTCPGSETSTCKKGDASPRSEKTDSALNTHVNSSAEASASSSEASAKASHDTLHATASSEAGTHQKISDESDDSKPGSASQLSGDGKGGESTAYRFADGAPPVDDGPSKIDFMQHGASEVGAEKEASAAPTEADESKVPSSTKRGSELLSADQQLVESLIAAAAGNTEHGDGDTHMGDAATKSSQSVLDLSDCTLALSRSLKGGGPSTEDKLAMVTLLGLAGVQHRKSEDVTGSENGEDDDDADAASAQDSSRKEDCSDADELDDDSKAGKDSRIAKMPGKRGQRKKKDASGESKADGEDIDDEGDNDDEDGRGKSARKSRRDADGEEHKPRGRKGKNKDLDGIDRNMSREDRKMMAIMRQIEQMEQKEKAKAGPSTPRTDGKCDRDEAEDSVEVELPASHKKRKESEDDDLSSARKKARAGDEDKAPSSPRPSDIIPEIKPATVPKARGRPPIVKLTGKQKQIQEKEAGGALVGLRSHKAVTDAPRPVLPSMGKSTSHPVLQGEYDAVKKSLRFHGKKSYCWVQAALADLSEHHPHQKGAPEWLPASQKARLNPHRRMVDKKNFPAIKSCLAKWTYESQFPEAVTMSKMLAAQVAATKVEAQAAATEDEIDASAANEVKMEIDTPEVTETEAVKPAAPSPAEVEVKFEPSQEAAAVKAESVPETVKVENAEDNISSVKMEDTKSSAQVDDANSAVPDKSAAPDTSEAPLPVPSATPVCAPVSSAPPMSAASLSSIKPEPRIHRREHSDSDRADADRHVPSAPSMSGYADRTRFREAVAGGQVTTGYGSLAITIPLGGSQHGSQYAWDQRARSSDVSPLTKNDPAGIGQDVGGNVDQRWQRANDSPKTWIGKREGPTPTSLLGPNSPSKLASAAAAVNSWERARDRSEGRSSKSDTDPDTRWQRGKDSQSHWMGKRDGTGPPMPASPRVGDSAGNWGPRVAGRTSAWDQPPPQGETPRETSFSKDAPMADRDVDRSSLIRNLPDMREMRREPSPPIMRRRVPTPPPRSMYGGEMRERGMDMVGGGSGVVGGGGGGGGGGLSRESLRREREDALLRDREPPERDPPPRFMRSEIVRSEIVRSETRSNAPERTSDSPRSRGMLNQWDLGPRARSPRPLDRPMERPPPDRPPMERPMERPVMGRAISPPVRARSLSPRSKEVQREIQAARERRGGDRKDEWGRDIPESRRDGSECSPGPDDRDLPPRPMLGGLSGAGRGGWWGGGPGGPGRGRGGGTSVDDRPPAGIVRRQRPSMFASSASSRRTREDGYSNSPPRSR